MIKTFSTDRQDDLYFANLEGKGDYLKENSRKQLTVYLSYLKNYQKFLNTKSESIKFHWSRVEVPEAYPKDREVYALKLDFPENLDPTEADRHRIVLDDIYREDIRSLYCLGPQNNPSGRLQRQRHKILDVFEDDQIVIVDKVPSDNIVYPDLSDIKVSREIRAFTKLVDQPDRHMIPLLMLSVPQWKADWPDPQPIDDPTWEILTRDDIAGVDAQREMVKKALSTPDFAILEGPPGSGKTTVISELIIQLLKEGKRVLVVASTHVAVDNVLERIVDRKDIVVPIRIAPRDRNLPEEVEKLTYNQYVKTFKDDIINALAAKKKRSKVENDWLMSLHGEGADKILQDLLDSTINVVCGTTIGVLQYPQIREALAEGRFDPLFDVMIIDEASKTTFTEFLVPALFARKWIISGDPKQLSPFIERGLIEDQISGVLQQIHESWYGEDREGLSYKEFEQICMTSFEAMRAIDARKQGRTASALISTAGKSKKYILALGAQMLRLDHSLMLHSRDLDFTGAAERCISMNASDVIMEDVGKLGNLQDCIPCDALPVDGFRMPRQFDYRRNYLNRERRYAKDAYGIAQDTAESRNDLSDEISWRLIRAYELRNITERSDGYRNQVHQLIPNWMSENDDTERRISRIETISLPSVIEALINGIGDRSGPGRSVLLTGFNPGPKTQRWQRLTHQLRMHPEISFYPRRFVYSDEAGKALSLLDGNIDREWSYARYAERVAWKNVSGQETKIGRYGGMWNPEEVNAVLKEVRTFTEWASKNRRNDGRNWDIAVLTFYDKQTSELTSRLARIYGGRGPYFRLQGSNVRLFVGNVDSMQGREADVVYLSMVRTNHVGFLDSPNRLNVAITRSRYQLVILGDHRFFSRQNKDLLVTKLAAEIKPEYEIGGSGGEHI